MSEIKKKNRASLASTKATVPRAKKYDKKAL